ncbi:hypothetical protein [Streptomyces roseolilacinus]|uniref:Uncharacterized protein n=1 Tax=Streptomyces roseolilacinus TaxID=66904 RepID=A0A918B0A7_9ACTN|nr:hypothetical protein [Streptomyces roseolilacinus]GGQ07506.1 hypothetical protein GCM10010249_27210 [Streptomyces roseolilacinus]
MDTDLPGTPGGAGTAGIDVPDDLLAAAELVPAGPTAPRGGPPGGGVSLARPLVYALPAEGPRPRTALVCFPFDLEEPPDGHGYREVELAVTFDDEDLCALDLRPAPGAGAGGGERVSVFGLGRNRLRWVFRAGAGRAGLRPDGRWTQALVRLPGRFTEVHGRLTLRAVLDHPSPDGDHERAEVRTRDEVPFRLARPDTWLAASLAPAPSEPGTGALAAFREPPTPDGGLPPGQHRLCYAVDIEKYSARDNAGMIRAQRALMRVVKAACAHAGVDWAGCGRQAQGDGYLLVLLPDADVTRAVPRLMAGTAEALAAVNAEGDHGGTPLRMRACFHQGIVHEAESGYAGAAVVELFRILDSGPLRTRLAEERDTDLVTAFSDRLYQDLTPHGYDGLSPAGFERAGISVPAKGFTGTAWIRSHPRAPDRASGRAAAPAGRNPR